MAKKQVKINGYKFFDARICSLHVSIEAPVSQQKNVLLLML